jgi:glycosyltransferase involved in cell wall biosynthesis
VRLLAFGEGHGVESLRTAGAKVLPPVTGVERARAVASLDVVLQPRKRETYAPAVHEALASGVPVVAYATGTAADVVRHEHNGLLVGTDRGAKTLARSVARLVEDRALHARLAAHARDAVAQRTWDQAVSELLEVHYPAALRRPSLATG